MLYLRVVPGVLLQAVLRVPFDDFHRFGVDTDPVAGSQDQSRLSDRALGWSAGSEAPSPIHYNQIRVDDGVELGHLLLEPPQVHTPTVPPANETDRQLQAERESGPGVGLEARQVDDLLGSHRGFGQRHLLEIASANLGL